MLQERGKAFPLLDTVFIGEKADVDCTFCVKRPGLVARWWRRACAVGRPPSSRRFARHSHTHNDCEQTESCNEHCVLPCFCQGIIRDWQDARLGPRRQLTRSPYIRGVEGREPVYESHSEVVSRPRDRTMGITRSARRFHGIEFHGMARCRITRVSVVDTA